MSNEQANPIRMIISEELDASKDWTCNSSDDESYSDEDEIRASVNCRPSDEDIEAPRYWNYTPVPSILKYGNGTPYKYTKEDIELWGSKALNKRQTKQDQCFTTVPKPEPPKEGWAKWAHENPDKCKIRMR